ncbi:hypothetical protein BDN70DRAFT_875696 [Pholiota conissans]|uniref:Uncharacterized protein n=1 Tax=Pholiota conissans TaxID=109636 RepID=A0A9P6D3R7_9AGAR|nr:hypothetical protein BDN70DRAFT_875696 [Pholiota conissans]
MSHIATWDECSLYFMHLSIPRFVDGLAFSLWSILLFSTPALHQVLLDARTRSLA